MDSLLVNNVTESTKLNQILEFTFITENLLSRSGLHVGLQFIFTFFLTPAYFPTRSFNFQKLNKIFPSSAVLAIRFLSVRVGGMERGLIFSASKTLKLPSNSQDLAPASPLF